MIDLIFYTVLGQPFFVWFGVIVFISIFTAGLYGFLVGKGKAKMNLHVNIARFAIVLALLYGLMMVLVVLK
ncbi:MAG: hypothetical protein NTW66_02585 [Candidatus Magasanikbacteria bacterium]|nr:hypothetical protein [Candidatus Magasanikbacteria bacterium]